MKKKKFLKLALKIALTGLAVYLVFRKINAQATWEAIQTANWSWLFLALVFFVFSKVLSAFRLNCYFRDLQIRLPEMANIKLYSIGMFYNLFLPGGIGGDGYKVYLLKKSHQKPVKPLLAAVLLDRINGLAVLVLLLFGLTLWVEIDLPEAWEKGIKGLALSGFFIVPLGFWLMVRWWFPSFRSSIILTGGYSLLTQLSQLICAYFILLSLGITARILAYQFVFLLSSIVAVLPLTIGGVGARELVFIYSHDYMGIDQNAAVAFSLLFFLITALVSFIGAFIKVELKEITAPEAVDA